MPKRKLNFRRVGIAILLLLSMLFPLIQLTNGANGFIGVTYYPSGYNITTGTFFSGSVPASVQAVDQDYFIANSSGSATLTNAYNPSSHNPLGNTTLLSGAVENLASDDGVYMTFRSYENTSCSLQHYNSSNADSSSASVTYVDKVVLTFTPSLPGNYLIIASAELRGSSNAYAVQVQMTIDGLTHANPIWQPDDANMWESFFTSKVINLNNSVHTIRMQYASEDAAQTVTIRNARIMALLLSDFEANETEAEQTVTSGTYVDVVSKTFTPSTPGVYLISATAEVSAASTAYSIYTRLEIDGDAKDTMVTEGEAVTDYEVFAAHNVTILSATAHTIKIQASRETIGTMYVRRARITAVRLSDHYDYRTSSSEQQSSTTSTTWVDKTALTFAPSALGNYLIMATAKISLSTSSAGNQPAINLTMDGTQIGFWQAGLSDATDFLTFAAMASVSLSPLSHTFKIAYRTTSAFYAASIRDARIVAIRLPRQYVSEVEFVGISNDYNWADLSIAVDSSWTAGYVSVCIQIYDYQYHLYPSSGQAYASYTSSGTPDTEELYTLNIASDPSHYKNSTANWKVRMKGVRNTSVQPVPFEFKVDHVEFKPTHYTEHTVSTEFLFSSLTPNTPAQLNFTVVSHYSLADVSVTVQAWDYSASAYATSGQGYLQYVSTGTNETALLRLNIDPQFFVSSRNARIRIVGVLLTTIKYWQVINQVELIYSYVNSPPILNPIGNKIVGELTELTFTATATDPDFPVQPLTYALDTSAPDGAFITVDGIFTWTPTEEQGPGNYPIRVIVSDGLLTDYEDLVVTVFEVHIHDVAIVNATVSPANIMSGEIVTIIVTVKNQGTATETFNITVFYDGVAIETRMITGLIPDGEQIVEFSWNTTGLSDAAYRIRAEASRVTSETDTSNNTYVASVLTVGAQSLLLPVDWFVAIFCVLLVMLGLFLFLYTQRRRKKTRSYLFKKTGSFSAMFGMTHRQMMGKKMLLEIDPTSDYHLVIPSFVSESKTSDEPLYIVTSKNSAQHSSLSGESHVRFLLLTSKTHYPQQISEKETLLPADDLSVLLDTCTKVQEAETHKAINLLLDNFSDIILRCGFEKTYNFTRLLLEALSSSRATALFMFVPTAHDQEVSSSIRSLFRDRLAYTKDGPKTGNA